MTKFTKTWWGDKFIEVLERVMDSGRLSRGRSYANRGRVLDFQLAEGKITAVVRGNKNPYFGVYKEPKYKTTIKIDPISKKDWQELIKLIGSKASLVSRLLMNEMPDNIENAFAELGLHLLPKQSSDLITDCSCPDWSNPCKHIAGVYYLLASEFDRDPFLMFKLRGLEQKQLQIELGKTALGKILLSEFEEEEITLKNTTSYYTRPHIQQVNNVNFKEFWLGNRQLPPQVEPASEMNVPAALIKKQGDFPSFWEKEISFVGVMEELYERIRTKNKRIL